MGPYLTTVGVFGLEFADIFKWAHLDYIVSDVRSIYPTLGIYEDHSTREACL